MAKKTWSSLPKSDFPNVNRQNSVGSLDRNYGGGVSMKRVFWYNLKPLTLNLPDVDRSFQRAIEGHLLFKVLCRN